MADERELPRPPPEAARVYQMPEWETPTRPPKRSMLQRLSNSYSSAGHPTFLHSSRTSSQENTVQKETLGILPTHTNTFNTTETRQLTVRERLQQRFDALVPPERSYFGRSRRFFLLAIVLPIFLLLVFVLALGLGLGLRKKGGPQHLPLPGNGAEVYTGDLTYFNLAVGACGGTNSDSDLVCAVGHDVFDAASTGSDPNHNPLCGKKIRIVRDNVEGGQGNVSVDVTVVDRCVGCGPTDLDLSPGAFDQLAPESAGRVTGSWSWLE
ncbi:hypothetical protein GQ53DRAFT_747331 [Thozetella sp. PMI_491]|nr:hypothetical protein GQ53DRAFT_747331 [Thozetella sp. PMI_491]